MNVNKEYRQCKREFKKNEREDRREQQVRNAVAKEVYALMTGEFVPYIDTDIAKEIIGRIGVKIE